MALPKHWISFDTDRYLYPSHENRAITLCIKGKQSPLKFEEAAEEKKEEPKEESDEDMGFGLFD
ncbi:hypothetical protein ANCDUO_11945 [Ancylostoma duodenale]|uniref:Uncharacterized protein n=1 Tax=Ancylostoma duodenale TaxID=51022 RepID=A0A0C2CMN3_9BILA|nr:hypothetical protein ANCDUO_11945 [Ancylostoma duodenale]